MAQTQNPGQGGREDLQGASWEEEKGECLMGS